MQKIDLFLPGKMVHGLISLCLVITLSSCSSDCRKLDGLFGRVIEDEVIGLADWHMLTGNLSNNYSEYINCARGLYSNGHNLNKDAVLTKISSTARKNRVETGFSRELTLELLSEKINSLIAEGATLKTIGERVGVFTANHQNLLSAYYPELYEGKEHISKLVDEFYDSRVISPRLYLERSGSMVFYDAGNRNFVTAMRQIINRFPQYSMDKRLVHVVADRITHWDIPFSEFLQVSNVFGETRDMVDASWTDFPAIFRDILNNTRDNEISILFTDMIYDVETTTPGISPEGFAGQGQEMTHAIFNTHGADFGMIIIKMNGDYEGRYYPPMATPFSYKGNRPYYISLIGKTPTLQKLMTAQQYRAVKEFQTLPGFEASHAIYRMRQSPWYSVVVPHNRNSRYVQPSRASLQSGRISQLTDARIHDRENKFSFVMAADLSGLWFDESFKTDPANYRVNSSDGFFIEEIVPLDDSDLSSPAKRFAGDATHLIVLQTDRLSNPRQQITIDVINEFPRWITSSSTLDDTRGDTGGFAHATFGLEQMVRGIYNAFYQAEGNSIMRFNIELN
jgi:hypothetical protein